MRNFTSVSKRWFMKISYLVFVFVSWLLFNSSLAKAQTTVVDVIVNSEDHATLEAAVIAAGLDEALSGDGPFTVFAPTDAAFDALPEGTLEALLADPTGELTKILTYHVVAAKAMSADLTDSMEVTTLEGRKLLVTITDAGVFINGAQVTTADIETDNGVVHVIDAVLIPERVTVVDVIVNSEDHTTLEAAVIAAGLVEALSGDGPFTVFAPTDAAFDALPEGTLEALLADPTGELTKILTYHVVAARAMSADLTDSMEVTTLEGRKLLVTITDAGVFINGAQVTTADIETDNGVVHVIDAVLIPERVTVVDVIVNSEDHTTLEAAVIAAGLDEALSGDGPFTVFAPTDAAFDALPEGTLEALLADPSGELTKILTYHVVAARAMSADLTDSMEVTTLEGRKLLVTITDEGVFINGAQVTTADIETDNGVVHVIDAVLIPETTTSAALPLSNIPPIRIYPNPATTNVTIDIGTQYANYDASISIIGIDGRVVYQRSVSQSRTQIPIGNLNRGMYVVVFRTSEGVQTEKLIVR